MDRLAPGRTRNLWSPDADCVFRILPKFVGALGVPMAEWKPGVVANPGVEKGGWPNSGSNCGAVRRKMGRNLDWRLTSGSLDVGEGVSLLSGHAAPGSACAHGAGRNHRNLKRRHRASFGRCARWGVFLSAVPGRPQVCGAAGCRGMAMSDPVVGCNDRPLVGKRAGAAFSDSSVGHQPCGFARCAGRRQRSHRVAWGACTATRKTHWQPRRRAGFRDSCKTRRPCRLLRIRVATLGGSRVAADGPVSGCGAGVRGGPPWAAQLVWLRMHFSPVNTLSGHVKAMGVPKETLRRAVRMLIENQWAMEFRREGSRSPVIVPWMPPAVERMVVSELREVR